MGWLIRERLSLKVGDSGRAVCWPSHVGLKFRDLGEEKMLEQVIFFFCPDWSVGTKSLGNHLAGNT